MTSMWMVQFRSWTGKNRERWEQGSCDTFIIVCTKDRVQWMAVLWMVVDGVDAYAEVYYYSTRISSGCEKKN